MAVLESETHGKEIMEPTESNSSPELTGSSVDEKRRNTANSSSDDYDSDTGSSVDDDEIAIDVLDENGQLGESTSKGGANVLSRYTTGISVATTTDPNFEIDFEDGDLDNPRNWPLWYRCSVIGMISYATLTVVMYSTSYTSAMPGIMLSFSISNETIVILGITTYMFGLALGSVVLAPLSEMYGRRPIYLIAMAMFCILTIPCALAKNLEAILVTRFFGAIAGSAMIANSPGTVNDIVQEKHRAMAFSIWSIGPMNGPVVGPIVGGFVFQYLGWRWTLWVITIASGVGLVCLFMIKETYGPAILRQKAANRRKETNDERWWCRYDEKQPFWPLLRVNLSRPFQMAVQEPICIFWNLYIALLYAILYLCFVAYPIVFSDLRGWSPGITGLAYLGIGTGSLLCIAAEPLIRRMINAHKPDPVTGKPPPEAMVSIVCICAICVPVGEMIFAWTCTPNVHWIAPILAGIPFGFGNCGVFIYATNYLVHSYGVFAASALAGNSVFRSIMAATLPLAGPALYATLGPNWAGTLLALLELACVPIPFVFYKYGHRIRMKSALIRQMQEDKDKLDAKKSDHEAKMARHAARARLNDRTDRDVEKLSPMFGANMEKVISHNSNHLVA